MSGRAFSLVESDTINTIIISPIFRMQSESSEKLRDPSHLSVQL